MADDTSKRGAGDRARVAGEEPYEIGYFASKHGISREEAQALIDRLGNDRAKLDAAAQRNTPTTSRRTRSARATKPTGTVDRKSMAKKPAAKKPRAASVATAASPMAAITTPLAKAVSPAKRQAARAAKDAATAAQRSSIKARSAATKLPAAVKKRAKNIGGSAKAAAASPTAKLVGAAAVGLVAGLAVNLGRKVAVQAPSALAGDWFEALKVEHKLALTLFDQLQATNDSQTAKRSGLLVQLKHALSKHAFTEENVIYPALREWGDKADADKLNHDHGYVKQSLFELESMDKAAPVFMRKVADFRADLEAHISEEEEAIFPRMHASLSDDRNAALTARANKEGFKLA